MTHFEVWHIDIYALVVNLMTLSVVLNTWRLMMGLLVNNELQRTWKEVAVN